LDGVYIYTYLLLIFTTEPFSRKFNRQWDNIGTTTAAIQWPNTSSSVVSMPPSSTLCRASLKAETYDHVARDQRFGMLWPYLLLVNHPMNTVFRNIPYYHKNGILDHKGMFLFLSSFYGPDEHGILQSSGP